MNDLGFTYGVMKNRDGNFCIGEFYYEDGNYEGKTESFFIQEIAECADADAVVDYLEKVLNDLKNHKEKGFKRVEWNNGD